MAKHKTKDKERGGRPIKTVPSRDKAVQVFESTVPLDRFSEACELAKDQRFEMLARLMADPGRLHQSFASKMIQAGVTLADLYDFWNKHQMHRVLLTFTNRMPKIADDVCTDAESRMTACSRCDGLGEVIDMVPGSDGAEAERRTCPVCEGTKKMRVIGDKAARDLAFESFGLTGKRPPMVAIQQNFGLESELGDVLLASQKVITGGSE